jgi:hypothetical protein
LFLHWLLVPSDTSTATQLPIRCFLSYAKADDEEYQFVAALKKSLEHACWSDGGRKLQIFLDRQDIGWGDNWRDKIADSRPAADHRGHAGGEGHPGSGQHAAR